KLRRSLPSNLLYSEDDPPARFLYFPPDHSVGKLYIYPRSAPSGAKWEELGEARGSIKVRVAHWRVWLSVSPGAATDFSFLTALKEDDFLLFDLAYTLVSDAE